MLVGEDIWDLGLHIFFFVFGFDVAAPIDGGIGMDLGAGEMVDWNGVGSPGSSNGSVNGCFLYHQSKSTTASCLNIFHELNNKIVM